MFGYRLLVLALVLPTALSVHFTILHVTDIHGWVNGHPHDDNLDADFGDFASLVQHMSENARASGDVFLLYDSGDLTEGTGLSDAYQIHGYYIFPIIEDVGKYTALSIGNHDLGHDNQVQVLKNSFAPHWNKGDEPPRYLTANSFALDGKDGPKTIGEKYSINEVSPGIKVLSMGFIYNFTQHSPNSEVISISETLQEKWFAEAMAEPDISIYVVTSHIDPQSSPELQQIYAAVRSHHPDSPLLLFSGHRHRLYFEWWDNECFTLESGKYFENIGVVDFDFSGGRIHKMTYEWVATTVANFQDLSRRNTSNFLTLKGREIKQKMAHYSSLLNLDESVGCAPYTYNVYGLIEYEDSIWNLWIENIIPALVFDNNTGAIPYYMTNTAALRSNIFEGEVNRNDIWTCEPFNDTFKYTRMSGSQLLEFISAVNGSDMDASLEDKLKYKRGDRAWNVMNENQNQPRRYVTL